MKIEILEFAIGDLVQGFDFYEGKQEGLGDHFLFCLFGDIEALGVTAGIHRKVFRGFHRALSKKFPVAIFYTVDGGVVRIRSVVDCRRKPSWIRGHLRQA